MKALRKAVLSFSLTLFIFPLCCFGQITDPHIILLRCAQAMGTFSQPTLHVIADGTESIDAENTVPIRIVTRDLRDFRIERGNTASREITIITNGRGWHDTGGKRTRIASHTAAYFKADHVPALLCSADHTRKGLGVSYVGEEVVGGKAAFHLKLVPLPKQNGQQADKTDALISEYHIFIDEQSFVVLKTARYAFSPNAVENRSLWEAFYSDYRNVNGVMMPFRLDNLISGRPFSTTIFTSITTGSVVPDQEFAEVN